MPEPDDQPPSAANVLGQEADPAVPDQPVLAMSGVGVWVPAPNRRRKGLVEGIDWTVAEGEHWALLGPNGAGKSTLLRMAAGLRHPSSGRVEILGRPLGRVDVRSLWPLIGTVAANHPAPRDLFAEEVVLTGATGTARPLPGHDTPEVRQRAGRLMSLLGVAHLVSQEYGTCSDGERARVLIARALMPRPRLLLLDEPTAGLDMAGREGLLAALAALGAAEASLASVVVCHHLEDLPVTTSHALLLAGGRTVASGPVGGVLVDEVVSRCFGVEVQVLRNRGRWAGVAAPPASPPAQPASPIWE